MSTQIGMHPGLDDIDRRILAALRRNGALTGAQVGEAVGLSPSAAHRRVKLLEDRGHILGYRARLSQAARGDPSTAFASVTLRDQAQSTLARFEDALKRCPEIDEAHLMSGQSDYLLKVQVCAGDSFERIHREVLSQLPGVLRLVSHFSIRPIVQPD